MWKWEPSLEGTSPSHHEYKSVLLASGSFLNLEIQTCPLKPGIWNPCCFYRQPELRSSLFFLRSLNDSGTGLLRHAKATTHTHNRCSPQTTRVLSIVRSSPEMPQLGLAHRHLLRNDAEGAQGDEKRSFLSLLKYDHQRRNRSIQRASCTSVRKGEL